MVLSCVKAYQIFRVQECAGKISIIAKLAAKYKLIVFFVNKRLREH